MTTCTSTPTPSGRSATSDDALTRRAPPARLRTTCAGRRCCREPEAARYDRPGDRRGVESALGKGDGPEGRLPHDARDEPHLDVGRHDPRSSRRSIPLVRAAPWVGNRRACRDGRGECRTRRCGSRARCRRWSCSRGQRLVDARSRGWRGVRLTGEASGEDESEGDNRDEALRRGRLRTSLGGSRLPLGSITPDGLDVP